MNNRISEAFAKGKAFIPFITCGDPSLEITEQLVYAMEEAGADLIELGIPFSDPTAEGPVIQEANVRALSGGVTTDKIFDMVVKIRKKTSPSQSCIYENLGLHIGVHEGEDHTGESIGLIRFTPWEAVVVAADVAMKSADVQIGFMDRFCGSLIITGGLSQVQTAVEEVVRFFDRELGFKTCAVHRS